ncbi:inhibitor of Bruton tyrosine kinase [Paramuricea clavata]|uniref:Inhibitor of Bruton tyrosine kinase n=2 Tax=Paramuricea clavata TaxID=317549 RepID=A0A7D9IFW5_PARCT|nr:inhibitor of Bruton tyrosine kinase [Paramuricea clavata]
MPLTRVRHTHRAVRIICDKYSQNIAVLQAHPSFGCSTIPHVSPPEMTNDMKTLFEDRSDSHDLEMKVKEKTIYAHQVVLAQGSDKLRTLINECKQEVCLEYSQTPLIYLDEEDIEIMNEMIEFLYTGSCASLPLRDGKNCERQLTDEDILDELALGLQDVDFDNLDTVYFEPEPVKRDKKSTRSKKNKKDGGNKDLGSAGSEYSGELSGKRKELLRVAKKYRITELFSRLQDSDQSEMRQRCFHRSKLSEYCDVVMEAEDEVEFSCHKCILVSRLEYFSMMLTTGWMESSEEFVRLKMPIPSRVLKVIIEFLYTDEAPTVKDSKDLEFLGKVLTVADQLWIIRLREMCEATLASLISLKNAIEMLEFSCLYNAEKLKNVCLEFICMNVSSLFEAGSLEMLSEDVLDELSKAYRQMIPRVSWRVITPNDVHLSVPWPQAESPKTKRKTSRSQRKSRTSESDVTEECAVRQNGTEVSELAKENIEVEEKLAENKQNVDKHDNVLASESKSESRNSSQDVVHVGKTEKSNNGLWYQKSSSDCPTLVNPVLATKKVQKTGSSPRPVGSRKNNESDEKQPWGSQSLSPQSSNLRTIMEQQEKKVQLEKPRKEGKSPLSGKTRLSQKERKKIWRSAEEQDSLLHNSSEPPELNGHDIATSPVNPWNSFSPLSRPSLSFRELLQEEESLGTSVSSPKKKNKVVKRNLFVADEKCQTTSAWQQNNVACSPPNNSNMKFDKIQELQEQETANRERDMKKPLSLIQIEDKAIEQLLEHYGGRYNPCEYIVVERQTRSAGSPDWVK